jgi:hypothetical protein
LGKYKFVFD